jgi:hypothetical protein
MPTDSQNQSGTDPLVRFLKRLGLPLTRENYLMMAYPDREDPELGAEEESMLPEEIQIKS